MTRRSEATSALLFFTLLGACHGDDAPSSSATTAGTAGEGAPATRAVEVGADHVSEDAELSDEGASTGGVPAVPEIPGDLRAVADAVAFSWSDEQPAEAGVLLFDVRNGTDGRVRLRLSYDLGAACAGHGPHLLPRVSLEPGEVATRPLRWERDHGEVPAVTKLRLFAALRYPVALEAEEVASRMVGGAPLGVGP